ncbi:hypothetical protein K9B33_20890 [Sphingobium sp. 3R8]|uniref:hypothetical protein n=1 Tax=Sphingobium sp. 3R8 TaxID=2874921 RepID=UPI001CCA24A0|nr:hypothetical protein [Sphingobium sp. 3R8]MBZ9649995.1 hypothetical protein [Sphingobium sp. 3R8]
MAKAGSLYTSLTLESSQFVVGLKKSVDQAAKSGAAIEQHLNRARSAATAMVGFWTGSEIVAAAKRALDYASSLGEVSQQLGVTATELQEYRYVATQVGISQEEMDKSLAKLTRTIGDAKSGAKAQVSSFRELGVAIEDSNGRVYTAGELIPKIADALEKVKDPATRARIEVDLFGKSGQRLDTMLAGGSNAVNELRDAAHKLGVVLSEEQIQKADETADKLAELKMVLESRVAGVVTDNASAIIALANAVGYLTGKLGAAVQAYVRFKAEQGIQLEQGKLEGIAGYFTDDKEKAVARGRIKQYRDLLIANGGSVTDPTYLRERSLRDARNLFGYTPPPKAVGDGALPTSTASPSRKKTGGASGPSAEEIQEQYRNQLRSIVGQTLSANASMATTAQERAEIAHRQLNDDLRGQREEIDANKNFSKAQKDRLKEELGYQEQAERARIDAEMNDQLIDEEIDARREAVQREIQSLGIKEAIATTEAERRRLQLQILDKELELDRLSADGVLRKTLTNDAEKALAQAKLDNLATEKAQGTLAINQRTMGPLESYMKSIPKTADEINQAYENIAVNGIQHMNDALAESSARVLRLKGFAGQLFNQMISDLIRFQLQQATAGSGGFLGGLIKLGGSVLGLGGSSLGGVSASSLSYLDGQAAGLGVPRNLATFNQGGSFRIKGRPGIDQNVMSINGSRVARVGDGEIVNIERAGNDNGGHIAMIVPSPLFSVVMQREAAGVAGPMASQAAVSGSTGAQVAIARAGSKRIP